MAASKKIQTVDEQTLDAIPVPVILFDEKKIYFANKEAIKFFSIPKNALNELLEKGSFLQMLDDKKTARIQKSVKVILGGKTIYNSNLELKTYRGKTVLIESNATAVYFKNKKVVMSVLYEVTERATKEKETENTLLQKTAQMRSIFESSPHLIWTVNKKYQITSFNQNFYNTVMSLRGVNLTIGCKIDEHITERRQEYIDFWYKKYDEAFKGNKVEFEKEDENSKNAVYRKVFVSPIFNSQDKIVEISCIAHDITESKIYEHKLLNQSAKITAIFDSSSHYMWTISRNKQLSSFNKKFFDLIIAMFNIKPYIGLKTHEYLKTKSYWEVFDLSYQMVFKGKSINFEIEGEDIHNNKIFLEIFLNPIYENNNVVEVSAIAHNVTEKKLALRRIESSLKEKEVLLKEVHHRVKNNLQVISSILNLQSSYVTDENTRAILRESQNRIKTMAYIHESLYQDKSFISVNFSQYLKTLVNNVVQSYSSSEEKIKVEINAEQIMLSLDNSIPAGLIVNELVTNAIKHAFSGSRTGTVSLNLKHENNRVFIELKDNGSGFADGIDFKNSNTLGLQLVNTLVEQLDGDIEFETRKDKGTRVLITFKI
ncbi:MAG: PAS domain S-box protein [Bacteroidetes bacterium]|nr:PAS domain S-box protein [Bacteroidota bacterium]